ncbi:MAG: SRPBCC domain-containing protein [Bdellovibrionaceae bacterium]|nr:SRPBCC domain-containing protein [Pseudobdellovibrionaceae bacterium]
MKAIFQESVHTTIVIEASREVVWSALSDFTTYGVWNKVSPRAIGHLAVGAGVKIEVDLPDMKITTTKATVIELKQFESICWVGNFWIRGLMDGYHSYRLKALNSQRTELAHDEIFKGLLVPFIWSSMGPKFTQRFNETNASLKLFVESKRHLKPA